MRTTPPTPLVPWPDLEFSGISYWALGHVHTRQVLSARSPTVVYPGNSQGRHPNEPGARGVYLVDIDDDGTVNLDFRAVDTVRWERPVLDISDMETEQDPDRRPASRNGRCSGK